jgi:membrane protein YqaA with SNARE-associated domain
MVDSIDNCLEPENNSSKKKLSKTRVIIFILEISLVALLLVFWLASDSIQKSNNLWILFLYSFPSQFLIAIVPHEPVFLYFSKFYAPIIVTLVSVSSTVLTEVVNYSTFKFIVDLKSFQRIRYSGFIKKLTENFNKAPFLALWVAGFTPIPFYPLRFLVVLAHYPLYKYIIAVFLSRSPRFYLLAWLGHVFKIPDYLLAILFALLILVAVAPVIKRLVFKNKKLKYSAEEMSGKIKNQS